MTMIMDRKKQLAAWRQMPQPKPTWEEFKRMRGPKGGWMGTETFMRWWKHQLPHN